MPRSDDELVAAWRGGDSDAASELIGRHYDGVVRFFRTKARAEMDDLIQQTFLRCASARDNYAGRGSFRAFVFGIARNVLLEYIRRRSRDLRVNPDAGVTSVRDLEIGASTALRQRSEQLAIVRALQTLPIELQLVLELFYWEELSVGELAEVLEIPEGTVKSRLFRARGLLRERLDDPSLGPASAESMEAVRQWAERLAARPE